MQFFADLKMHSHACGQGLGSLKAALRSCVLKLRCETRHGVPLAFGQVHSGPLRFHELDAFVDGVINGGPLEQKLQAGYWGNGQFKVSAAREIYRNFRCDM